MPNDSGDTDLSEGRPGGSAGSPAAPSSAEGSPDIVRILIRTLRGRFWLTLGMSLLVGGIGAAMGWYWAGPLYHSEGMIRIASVLPAVLEPTDQNQPIPMFESFMQAQQELLTGRSMLEAALRDPMWGAKGVGNLRPSVAAMAANLKVDTRPKSENLRISYNDPVAAVASSAVGSTIAEYQSVFDKESQSLDQQRLQLLEDYRGKLTQQLNTGTVQSTGNKTEPAPVVEIPLPSQFEIPSAAKVATVDPRMEALINRRNDVMDQIDEASEEFGPNHPYMVRLSKAYAVASERVHRYLNDYLSSHTVTESISASPAIVWGGSTAAPASPPNVSMQQTVGELDRVNRRIELLKTEAAMPKRFEVVDVGDLPVRLPGRQIKWTVAGAGLGGGMVMGIMILIGSNNKRFRMCADVIETLGKRLPFVTAVPNLGAGSKQRHLADAARSMHYFRQRLRQNGAAYMVTSADWDEGRTSVTMSLAISLCGSGARTIVIDADLATRGLTRALNMDNRPGFVEMVRNGEAAEPVNMPNNGIAILPAGAATEADGVSISAPAFARLLKGLKAEFDVVLIDSGPTLGRIEACVMARQVDGIVLAIGRGQEHSLWDETLSELEPVGAICGAVFNRADPKDFDRTVRWRFSGHANERLRPVSGPLANLGPLVGAVALSITQDIKLFPITGEAMANSKKVA